MTLKQNFELMAKYNQWINQNIYQAASELDKSELDKDMGAFFGSISGTLNHIMVGDIIWLKRFRTHPANFKSLSELDNIDLPKELSEIIYKEFGGLKEAREKLDKIIINFLNEITDNDLESGLEYRNTKGLNFNKKMAYLLHHFFNHQTHHRGQVSTLMIQLGVDIGVTDLAAIIPDNQ